MADTIIKTEELAFSYPTEEGQAPLAALNGVSLEIERGSFVAVLGHNGSGKSTLAKHINAVLLPAGGTVWVDGMDTCDEQYLLEIRRRVGMVFQNPDNQIVANVVEEDVAFGPENLGVPTEEIRRRVDAALKAVGMEEFVLQAPHHLSGGQKQRIAIAGIIAMEPACIVLDQRSAGGAGHRPAAEPGEGDHGGPYHPPHGRGGYGGPDHRDGRRPVGDGWYAQRDFAPDDGTAGDWSGCTPYGGASLWPPGGWF